MGFMGNIECFFLVPPIPLPFDIDEVGPRILVDCCWTEMEHNAVIPVPILVNIYDVLPWVR